jgi:predicted amidohydrolase
VNDHSLGHLSRVAIIIAAVVGCGGQGAASESSAVPAVPRLKVAVAQPLVVPGDVAQNIRAMEPLVVEAARRGAQLVLFSECGITGYDLKGVGAAAALTLEDAALERIATLARANSVVIVAGLNERRNGQLHNTAVAFFPDGRRVVQRKHHIMDQEQKVAPVVPGGRSRTIFEVCGFRCAVLICSDDGMPGIYEELAAAGCHVVLLPTAGAGSVSLGFHQRELADPARRQKFLDAAVPCLSREGVERSIVRQIAVAACNQMGWNERTGYFHPGGSSIVDRSGEVTAVIPPRFVFEHLRPDLAVGLVSR